MELNSTKDSTVIRCTDVFPFMLLIGMISIKRIEMVSGLFLFCPFIFEYMRRFYLNPKFINN